MHISPIIDKYAIIALYNLDYFSEYKKYKLNKL